MAKEMDWSGDYEHALKEFMERFAAGPLHWVGMLMAGVCAAVAARAMKRGLDWRDLDVLEQLYEEEVAGHSYSQTIKDPKTRHLFQIKGVYAPTLLKMAKWIESEVVPMAIGHVEQDQSQTCLAAALTVLAAKGRK
ncbi:hypothetical protein LCGC14_1166260 [marine sediment metagenome]|uniref:Uncharacterized protein n=1 Tax=marine sediment metagenome TaxID=412755 RepID=A0A0F9PWN6_9ZZZZ